MSAKSVNKVFGELFIFVAFLFVLLLSMVNIKNYQSPKKVLGAKTQIVSDDAFWKEFLKENPNYIPGWIETGRLDKIKEIDPNYNLDTSK